MSITKDTTVHIYQAGGFTGTVMGNPICASLKGLPTKEFNRVKYILKKLQGPTTHMRRGPHRTGDYRCFVEIGNGAQLSPVFKSTMMAHLPATVSELAEILKDQRISRAKHHRAGEFHITGWQKKTS